MKYVGGGVGETGAAGKLLLRHSASGLVSLQATGARVVLEQLSPGRWWLTVDADGDVWHVDLASRDRINAGVTAGQGTAGWLAAWLASLSR